MLPSEVQLAKLVAAGGNKHGSPDKLHSSVWGCFLERVAYEITDMLRRDPGDALKAGLLEAASAHVIGFKVDNSCTERHLEAGFEAGKLVYRGCAKWFTRNDMSSRAVLKKMLVQQPAVALAVGAASNVRKFDVVR